jgi:hypothetical protein
MTPSAGTSCPTQSLPVRQTYPDSGTAPASAFGCSLVGWLTMTALAAVFEMALELLLHSRTR